MAKVVKRLGGGLWSIKYKGRIHKRVIHRRVVGGHVVWYANIFGKMIRVDH